MGNHGVVQWRSRFRRSAPAARWKVGATSRSTLLPERAVSGQERGDATDSQHQLRLLPVDPVPVRGCAAQTELALHRRGVLRQLYVALRQQHPFHESVVDESRWELRSEML